MARGNRRARIFEDDDDRRIFLELIAQTVVRYEVKVYASCLMDNHYHFIAETPRGNLSDAMRHVNGVFAQTSNRRHRRSGHLFEARFRSLVIQFERYLKRATRYVHLNPPRAHIATDPASWAWSSYRATVGLEAPPEWLCLDWLQRAFEAPTREEAQRHYALYVNSPTARKARINTRAVAIGSKRFVRRIAEEAAPRRPDRPLPPVLVPVERPPLARLFDGVRCNGAARDQAIYDAVIRHGYRMSEIASQLGLDPSTVSKAVRRVRLRASA